MKENSYNDELLDSSNSNTKSNNNNLKTKNSRLEELIDQENLIKLSPKGRNIVFILYLVSNILISMDHGSIPASINELRQLTSYDQSIGLFGSLVYLGNIFGSMIFFSYINTFNRKILLLISL